MLTVDILNTICNHDCFADCSLDLTLIVSFLENCIFSVLLKANNNITILKLNSPETELTCNLAHNVQMDVGVFSVIFNAFCSVS